MPNERISSSARSGAMSGGTHTGSRFITSATAIVRDRPPCRGRTSRRIARYDTSPTSVRRSSSTSTWRMRCQSMQVGGQLDRVVLGAR